MLEQDVLSESPSDSLLDRKDHDVSDRPGEAHRVAQGGKSGSNAVLNGFGDPNSHFAELLGGHAEWRSFRQPEALQNLWDNLQHDVPWAEQFGAGSLLLLLCQGPGVLPGLVDNLGMSVG